MKEETQMHTPGPWIAGRDGNLRVYGPDGSYEHAGLVAEVFGRANLRLIAAAPDLLAACKVASALAWDYVYGELHGTSMYEAAAAKLNAVDAAILKAEGR